MSRIRNVGRTRRGVVAGVAVGMLLAGYGASGSTASTGSSAPDPAGAGADLEGTVFYLMPNATTPRYPNSDAPAIEAALAELAPNLTLELLNAEGDPQQQVQQAETAISRGAVAIILTAAFPEVPPPLSRQLVAGGRLVQPIGPGGREDVTLFVMHQHGLSRLRSIVPARFVPLYGEHGFPLEQAPRTR